MIGIINYGSGNFTSVFNAVNGLTEQVIAVGKNEDFSKCSHIILPGVGAFKRAMDQLSKLNLIDSLNEYVINQKRPFLGICVGMQILCEYGFEFEKCKGLGWVDVEVNRFDEERTGSLHLPHMGWNDVIDYEEEPLFRGINEDDPSFYFVHSFHIGVKESIDIKYTMTEYGYLFPAAIRKDNIFGVQFHPEKSQANGMKLLENFISL